MRVGLSDIIYRGRPSKHGQKVFFLRASCENKKSFTEHKIHKHKIIIVTPKQNLMTSSVVIMVWLILRSVNMPFDLFHHVQLLLWEGGGLHYSWGWRLCQWDFPEDLSACVQGQPQPAENVLTPAKLPIISHVFIFSHIETPHIS